MIIITTLNGKLAKLIKSGKLSKEELSEAYESVKKTYKDEQKTMKYVGIGLSIFYIFAYIYQTQYGGYDFNLIEFVGMYVFSAVLLFCCGAVLTNIIKWQFLRAVKKGYPDLVGQFTFK